MCVLRLALAGLLALTTTMAAQAAPPGTKAGPAVAVPTSIAQIRDGNGPGSHPAANGWGRGARQIPGHPHQWNGRSAGPWGPNGLPRAWGFQPGPGVPTYWVWGPSGGAFDYPFADWRGPTGGWGNP